MPSSDWRGAVPVQQASARASSLKAAAGSSCSAAGGATRPGASRPYVEGECLVFDDSFEHEVSHAGASGDRVVLSVQFFHPDLTDRQREASAYAEAAHRRKYLLHYGSGVTVLQAERGGGGA